MTDAASNDILDYTLVKSYKRLDTSSTMESDAIEAFSNIIPFIQERYPFIGFDPVPDSEPSRDSEDRYYMCGSYKSKIFGLIPNEKLILVKWGKSDYPIDEFHDDYNPIIQFASFWGGYEIAYEVGSLSQLERILANNIKMPKNRQQP